MGVSEFDFKTLEPLAAPVAPASEAATVLDVLAEAQEQADALRAAARAEGFAAGRAEAMASLGTALTALNQAAADVQSRHAAAADALERRAVELGLLLAQKIVAGVIAVEPERVVESVQGALRGIVERERVTVLVNPEDLEIVREAMEAIRASLGGIEHCIVESERRVARGGCIVHTPIGDVDGRVETKLDRAREVVEMALDRS
jgi:flagellar assembly protein FliH